jgi:hypothetical protein
MSNDKHNDKTWLELRKYKNTVITVAVRKYALELERLVVQQINKMGISTGGDLKKSIRHEVFIQGQKWVVRVGSNIKYAVFVHEGTRPHFPPSAPIKKWAYKKLGLRGQELDNATYLIQRKISKEGTEAQPFMKIVFEQEKHKAAKKIAKYARGLL